MFVRFRSLALAIVLAAGGAVRGATAGEDPSKARPPVRPADVLAHAKEIAERRDELENAGRYSEALPLAREVLALRESALGPDDSAVVVSLDKLAGLLEDTEAFAEAKTTYERALRIGEKILKLDDPLLAETLTCRRGAAPDAPPDASAEVAPHS